MAFEDWLNSASYTEKRKKVLRAARDRVELAGITRAFARIQAFLKFEKLTTEGDPRVIQPTTDEYLVVLGPMIKAIDKRLSQRRYEFTKGLNYEQLGCLFTEHVARWKDPVCISVDYSRFDAHVSAELLSVEHYVYCLTTNDTHLATLLAWQTVTRGKTRSGFEYTRPGGRCSGHPNTSCGNAILNLLIHRVILKQIGIRASVFVNGDDTLLITERAWAALWRPDLYVPFGMSVEGIVSELDWAEYCSGRFMPVDTRCFHFVRDLPKALLKLPWAIKKITPGEAALRRHDVLHAELSQQPAVPVYSAFCAYHHRREPCRAPNPRFLSWHLQHLDVASIPMREIAAESREWFHRVYGIDPPAQMLAESLITETGWSDVIGRLARVGFTPQVDCRETHASIFHHWNITYAPAIDQECTHPLGSPCALTLVGCCRDSLLGDCWDYAEKPEIPKSRFRRATKDLRPAVNKTYSHATSPFGVSTDFGRVFPETNEAWRAYKRESRRLNRYVRHAV